MLQILTLNLSESLEAGMATVVGGNLGC